MSSQERSPSHALLDPGDEGLSAFDSEGRCVYLNPFMQRLVRRDLEEAAASPLWELIPGDGEMALQQAFLQARRTGGMQEAVLFESASGRWFTHRIQPSGELLWMRSVDVTAQRRHEARRAALERLIDALGMSMTTAAVVSAVLKEGLTATGAAGGALFAHDEVGPSLRVIGAEGQGRDFVASVPRVPLDAELPATEAVRSREHLFIDNPEVLKRRYPKLRPDEGVRSWALLALATRGETLGVLALSYREDGPLPEDDRRFLDSVAKQCAQALDRVRLFEAERRARREAEFERRRLRELFMEAPAAVALVEGPEHRYVFSNPVNDALLGVVPKPGERAADLFPAEEGARFIQMLDRVYESGEPVVGREVPILRRLQDGSTREIFIDFTFQPTHDPDGKVNGVSCFAFEVTQAVHARAKLRLIVDALPVLVSYVKPDFTYALANRAYEAMTGRRTAEIEGHPLAEVLGPTAFGAVEGQMARALQGEAMSYETQLPHADGTARWLQISYVPDRDAAGQVRGLVVLGQDIDERRRGEARARFLAEATQRISASLDVERTLEVLADVVVPQVADWCVLDLLDSVGHVKRAVLRHEDPSKVALARRFREHFPVRLEDPAGAGAVLRTGKPELVKTPPDVGPDSALPAEYREAIAQLEIQAYLCVPLRSRGRVLAALTLVQTDSRRRFDEADLALAEELAHRASSWLDNAVLYEEAQQAVRTRDQFLSIASHELNTPLTTLKLNFQSLHRALQAPRQEGSLLVETKFQTMDRQLGRLAGLVRELLDVSRITSGRLRLEPEPLDLVALARENVTRLADDAARAGSVVTLHAPTSLPGEWDRLRLEQVLQNLLSNALKYGRGRPVEVALADAGAHAVLTVKDEGIGIAPEDQARLFHRFARVVSEKNYSGFGLGLWIVRQTVEAMGGTVSVQSALAEGSTFSVSVPKALPLPRAG